MIRSDKPKFLEMYVCGALAVLLGLIVIFGWITDWPLLIQILPSFAPMQFNTAFGFVLSGIIILCWYYAPRISVIVSIILLMLGLITILQYIFLYDLSIDEIFMAHYINTYTSHPGRMSPNTALCFVLFGFAYLMAFLQKTWSRICALASVLIVGSLGVISIFGYVFSLQFIFGWGNLTGMALHTAFGFSLIGLSCFREFLYQYKDIKLIESVVFPIIIFCVGFIIFLLSWQALVSLEDDKIKSDLDKNISFLKEELQLITDSRVEAIDRLFSRVLWLENYNKLLLENDINDYFAHDENLLLIASNYHQSNLKLYLQQNVLPETGGVIVSKCLKQVGNTEYKNGLVVGITNSYLCVYEPTRDLLAVFSTEFIESVFSSELFNGYYVSLGKDKQVYFIKADEDEVDGFYAGQWGEQASFNLAGESWDIRIWLNEQQVRDIASDYPIFFLFMGFIFTLLLSLSVRLWQNSKDKNVLLAESNQKFTAVMENTTTAIFIFNQHAIIVFVNNQAAILTGYSKEELIGMNLSELIPVSRRQGHKETIMHLIDDPKPRRMGYTGSEIHLLNKNNQEIPIEAGLSSIKIESQFCVLASVLDITQRKEAESKIQDYTQALKRSNDELDSFAYIASHDLKEPLRGIHNFSGLLLEDYADKLDEEGIHQLKTLQKLSSRMEELISNLLHFSRVGRTELAYGDCDINEIVNKKNTMLEDFIVRNNAEVIISERLPIIYCDAARIGEVFQNLITNGIKYNNKDHKVIKISYETKPDGVIFSVSDNGIGIDKENYENIFKIFKRLHSREEFGGGTGAGMTIVKKIIERHGGKIWLESSIGNGTTFYFNIPNKQGRNEDDR